MGTATASIRPQRAYGVYLQDRGGGEDTLTITIAAGTAEAQDAEARERATEALIDWIRDGAYGDGLASVEAYYTLSDDEGIWPRERVRVELTPGHQHLIHAAVCRALGVYASSAKYCGDDPDAHDWAGRSEDGAHKNPGVWSAGGTSISFRSHCRQCGLRRLVATAGSQRSPGDRDSVEYDMPERWCVGCQAAGLDHVCAS